MDINKVKISNANLSKNYTTHMTMLIKALEASKGDVVECGGGIFSTPLLHWMCKYMNRNLITYENVPAYYEFEHTFQSRQHSINLVKDWDDIDTITHRGVVFIDHHPSERRMVELERFKDSADYIVIHDSERETRDYNREEVYRFFRYRHDWKGCRPWTTVVSNFYDVSKWKI